MQYKYYLRLFLIMGGLFGVFVLIFDLADGTGFRLGKFLLNAFSFGLIMTLFHYFDQRARLKKMGKEFNAQNFSTTQKTVFRAALTKEELLERLKSDPFLQIVEVTENQEGLALMTKWTWESWGEKIVIHAKITSGGIYEYEITSQPKLKTVIFDFGKNSRNIQEIEMIASKG